VEEEEAAPKEEEMEIMEILAQMLVGEGALELVLAVGKEQPVDRLLISKDPKGVPQEYQVPMAGQVQGPGAHLEPEVV